MGMLLQDDLFNVEEIDRVNQQIREQEKKKEIFAARLSLDIPYFENPQNDNEKLLNYQYLYLKHDDKKAWDELFILAHTITKRIVWKWMKEKHVVLDEDEQDDKTSIALEYVLRRYKKNVGYAIKKNYISALKDGVTHAMLYTTKLDKETVYIDDVYEVQT